MLRGLDYWLGLDLLDPAVNEVGGVLQRDRRSAAAQVVFPWLGSSLVLVAMKLLQVSEAGRNSIKLAWLDHDVVLSVRVEDRLAER